MVRRSEIHVFQHLNKVSPDFCVQVPIWTPEKNENSKFTLEACPKLCSLRSTNTTNKNKTSIWLWPHQKKNAHVFDLWAPMRARNFMKFFVVVNHNCINLSLKFHKDPSFGYGDIGKIKLTLCKHYFSMYFATFIKTQFLAVNFTEGLSNT